MKLIANRCSEEELRTRESKKHVALVMGQQIVAL
jgi:hypothetical protein